MKYGRRRRKWPQTANISAANLANALGGMIGGAVVDQLVRRERHLSFAAAVSSHWSQRHALILYRSAPQRRSGS